MSTTAQPVPTTRQPQVNIPDIGGSISQLVQGLVQNPLGALPDIDVAQALQQLGIGGRSDSIAGLGLVSRGDIDNLIQGTQGLMQTGVNLGGVNIGGRSDSLLGLGLLSRSELTTFFNEMSRQLGQTLTTPIPQGVFRQSADPTAFNVAADFERFISGLQSTLGGYLEANNGTINSVCNSWGQMRPQFPSLGIYQALVGQDSPAWGGLLDFACNAFSPEYAAAQATAAPSEGLLTPFLVQAQQGASSATNAVGQLWNQATGAAAGLAGQGAGNLGRFIIPGGGVASGTSARRLAPTGGVELSP